MATGSDSDQPEWRVVEEVPISDTIYDVAQTKEGPYAIASDGTMIANRDQDDQWNVVFDDGPATRNNRLKAMDVTDDGARLWFLGSSGALGCYDVKERRKYDYSFPKEMTSTWEGIAVSGKAGSEKALAANGSGEVMPFAIDGFDVDWGVARKPGGGKYSGSGANISALAAGPDGIGYAVNTSGAAFRTTKEEGWEQIGIVNAQVNFYDIYAGPQGRVYVAAGDGRLYRYDDSYHSWTPIGVAKGALRAVDIFQDKIVALGAGGNIYQRTMGGQRWEKIHTPTSATLYDMVLGYPDVAVGKGGTIMVRPRGQTRHSGKSKDGDNYEGRGELWDGTDDDENQSSGGSSSGDSTSGDSTSGDSTSGDSTSGDSTSGDSTSGDSTSGDSTSS
ncbi:WD40/YVTN/BNR-like repeat-containing protein [Halospeciosus flavus]|uniref:WD40/YVTN/BNR-like repeat-containing protein n=1 Tax=Halospeciosus flavus TaxID=3032283 RepID=UPI00360CF122